MISIPEAVRLDPDIVEVLTAVRDMAGAEQMTYSPQDSYIRGSWFAGGLGRALIGFSETMSVMGEVAGHVAFHRISLSEDDDIPMLYADLASINAGIGEEKKPYALELLNLITGTEVLTQAFAPVREDQNPQYLLSARMSVYDALSAEYPVYGALKGIVSDPRSRVFVVRPGGRALLEQGTKSLSLLLHSENEN